MGQPKFLTTAESTRPARKKKSGAATLAALSLRTDPCGLPASSSVRVGVLAVVAVAAAWPHAVKAQGGDGAAPDRDANVPTLPMVKATALPESAVGPVPGYVAQRSTTATKTDTPLIETPRSVSVITREQMDVQQNPSVLSVLQYAVGVVAQSEGAAVDDSRISIRGFEMLDGDAFYRDGLRVKNRGWWSYSATEPYGLERVEVLRGPASVLYGQGQPNGTINMVSKRPSTVRSNEIGVRYGSHATRQVAGDFTGALDQDGTWSYRVTGLLREGKTQVDFSKNDRQYLLGSLAWRPSARTELILRAEYQRNAGEQSPGLPAEGTVLPNPNGRLPVNRSDSNDNNAHYKNQSLGYQLTHQLDDVWALRQNLRLGNVSGERRVMYIVGYTDASKRTVDRWNSSYSAQPGNYTVGVDNQAEAKFARGGSEHTLLIGLDYMRQRDRWKYGFGTAAPLDLYAPVYTPVTYGAQSTQRTQSDQQLGLYVQDQIKFDKKVVVSLGARRDWAKNETEFLFLTSGMAVPSKQKDTANTWNLGLAYLVDGGMTPYVSYATSFVPTIGTNLAGAALEPETGRQVEAGLKYQPPGSATMMSAAVFDLRKQHVSTQDPANPANLLQTGEVQSRGLEFESKSELTRAVSLLGNLAYTNARITRSNDGTQGNRQQKVPKIAASVWIDYAFHQGALARLNVAGGVRHIGKSFGDQANSFEVPAYTVLDLALRYDLAGLSAGLSGTQLTLNVSNLTDEKYAACASGFCQYGTGRNITAGARYRW